MFVLVISSQVIYEGSKFFLFSLKFVIVCLFSHSNECEIVSNYDFDLNFSND